MNIKARASGFAAATLAAPFVLAACGAAPGSMPEGSESTSQASLAIATVPSGVQCVLVTATGTSIVSQSFAVDPGASSVSLALGELPLGSVSITGQAFNVACASTAGISPSYVADPQTTILKAGLVTNLTMTFRPDNPVGATANFVGNVVDVEVGGEETYFLMSDGTVHASGITGLTTSTTVVAEPWLVNVAQISGGYASSCAVLTNGTVECWGSNSYGQLGNGTTVSTTTPVAVTGITNAVQVSVGGWHACAVLATGAVECWGYNGQGQLGNATTTSSSIPVAANVAWGGTTRVALGSNSTCSISGSEGYVYCWGSNTYGQLGNNTTTNNSTPVWVLAGTSLLDEVIDIAVGYDHVCALRADKTLHCWGLNGSGQIGNATTTNALSAVQLPLASVSKVAANADATCARTPAGVYCWGGDSNGELGDGTGNNELSPQLLSALAPTTRIVSSGTASAFCAQMADMTIDCWGGNSSGALGNGTTVNSFVPAVVSVQ